MPELELCRIRPMAKADLELVLSWRNSERIRAAMYTDHLITMEEHTSWFERVTREQKTFHYIFEYDSQAVGVVNVNGIVKANQTCHWGFYIGETDLPRGTATAMGYFAIEEIFANLNMRKIIGEAIASNPDSIKYHLRLGFVQEGILREHVLKNNATADIITFGLIDHEWKQKRTLLEQKYFDLSRTE